MTYLRVNNWEKHQHRDLSGKGNMPWLKLETGIFDDPAIAELTANEFRAYIRALTLAARTGNKLPASPAWLRAHFGTNWKPLCSRMVAGRLLIGTVPTKNPLQSARARRGGNAPTPRLEEKRGEEIRSNRSLEPLQDARARGDIDGESGGREAASTGASGTWLGTLGRVRAQAAERSEDVTPAPVDELELARARRQAIERAAEERAPLDFGALVDGVMPDG